jgi:hypothetical protein
MKMKTLFMVILGLSFCICLSKAICPYVHSPQHTEKVNPKELKEEVEHMLQDGAYALRKWVEEEDLVSFPHAKAAFTTCNLANDKVTKHASTFRPNFMTRKLQAISCLRIALAVEEMAKGDEGRMADLVKFARENSMDIDEAKDDYGMKDIVARVANKLEDLRRLKEKQTMGAEKKTLAFEILS